MNANHFVCSAHLKDRFRGFLPVVVDIETAGIDPNRHALLEICMVFLENNPHGYLTPKSSHFEHLIPFPGAELDKVSLAFINVDPYQPLRFAVTETEALVKFFSLINAELKLHSCKQAVLVGHNAWFDLLFLKEAAKRAKLENPFHSFTCFDTATLAGLIYGQTVLAKAAEAAGILFNVNEAHSAVYDAEKTAELFCIMVNTWRDLKIKK